MTETEFKNLNIGDEVVVSFKKSPDYGRRFKLVKYLRFDINKCAFVESDKCEFMNRWLLGCGHAYFEPVDGEKIYMSYDMKHSYLYEETIGKGRCFKYLWIQRVE